MNAETTNSAPAVKGQLLIVDDEAKIRSLIRKYAEFEGYAVEEAADGIEEAVHERFSFAEYLPLVRVSAHSGRRVERLLPLAGRIYRNFSRTFTTAALNKAVRELVGRVSPPSVRGKEFKIRYTTQTGSAPPILTVFTNSAFPPPENYLRYLRNGLREHFPLEGSPLLLKFRKD